MILKIVEDGFGCASCSGPCFHNPDGARPWVLHQIPLFGLHDVVGQRHAVVGLEYLGGGQPRIFGVSFEKLLLVVVEADQGFEVDGRCELTNLEV